MVRLSLAALLLGLAACSGTATILPTGQPVPGAYYPAALPPPPTYAPSYAPTYAPGSTVALPPPRPF